MTQSLTRTLCLTTALLALLAPQPTAAETDALDCGSLLLAQVAACFDARETPLARDVTPGARLQTLVDINLGIVGRVDTPAPECNDITWTGTTIRFDYVFAGIRDPILADGAYYPATWTYLQDRASDNGRCITLSATCDLTVGPSDHFTARYDYIAGGPSYIYSFTGEYKGLTVTGGDFNYCARNAVSFDARVELVLPLHGESH